MGFIGGLRLPKNRLDRRDVKYKAGIKKDKTSISLIEYKKRTKSVLLSDKVSISLPQHYKHGKVIKRI